MLCKCSGKYIDIYFNLKITCFPLGFLRALPCSNKGLAISEMLDMLVPGNQSCSVSVSSVKEDVDQLPAKSKRKVSGKMI